MRYGALLGRWPTSTLTLSLLIGASRSPYCPFVYPVLAYMLTRVMCYGMSYADRAYGATGVWHLTQPPRGTALRYAFVVPTHTLCNAWCDLPLRVHAECHGTGVTPIGTDTTPVDTDFTPVGTDLTPVSTDLKPVGTDLTPVGTRLYGEPPRTSGLGPTEGVTGIPRESKS
eukprot:1701201-Rhodomonas_salina.1